MRLALGLYLLILGVLLGLEVALGALVAPVVFSPAKFLGEGVLTHFQSGVLMTAIFTKYNSLLTSTSWFIVFFEGLELLKKERNLRVKCFEFALGVANLALALLFVYYFTDVIVAAQEGGAAQTQTAEFASTHKGSEWCMAAMMLVQVVLFVSKSLSAPARQKGSVF